MYTIDVHICKTNYWIWSQYPENISNSIGKKPHIIQLRANDLKRHFAKEELQTTIEYMKKILNTINHQGNVNQNYTDISS
jgi:predicted nuclease of predicted toxin-antitoxin system